MSSQQIIKQQNQMKEIDKDRDNRTTTHKKENLFMAYFDSLNHSKLSSHNVSKLTSSTDYHQVFEDYSKRNSEINSIVTIYDNGHITEFFQQTHTHIQSHVFQSFPQKVKESIIEVNAFFCYQEPIQHSAQVPTFLNCQNYSRHLASSILPKWEEEQKDYPQQLERIQSQRINLFSLPPALSTSNPPVITKIELLLAEITSEKKRKHDNRFYEEAMTIKLSEFIDYVTEDHDQYLGLALNSKAFAIIRDINLFKGASIEGYLKLPLIEYFFSEYKDLQKYRVCNLKVSHKQAIKKEVCSEIRKKPSGSSSRNSGKYSQPTSKRNRKQILEEDWIGKLC